MKIREKWKIIRNRWFWSARNKMIKKIIKPKGDVLDVGCGNDTFLKEIQTQIERGWGFDIKIKKKTKEDKITIKHGNALKKFKYPSNFFDIVYLRDVIEHLKNPDFCLKEIARVLKKEGGLVLSTPNKKCLAYKIKGEKIHHEHLFELTPAELKDLVEKNGFFILKHEILPWPFNYFQVILCKLKK